MIIPILNSMGYLEILTISLVIILFIASFFSKKVSIRTLFEKIEGVGEESNEKQSSNVSEEKCRAIFERLFGMKFDCVRPEWLKNPETGRNLELDGYCSKIKTKIGIGLAFEYDGQQHASYNSYFHSSKDDFVLQVQRDFLKDRLCKAKGVLLIRIPHIISPNDFERYIKQELEKYSPYKILA